MKILKFSVGVMKTNCYFLVGENGECVVIDPGDEADKIIKRIEEGGYHCTHILLTHGHFDHIMALSALREATGAQVYIHEADAEMVTDSALNCMDLFSAETMRNAPAEHLMHDGDVITVGDIKIEVIHTPGHTPGSSCFLVGDSLICGDTVFRDGIGRYDLPGGDFGTLVGSLQKIAAMDENLRLCPGHGMSSTVGREKEYNIYMN